MICRKLITLFKRPPDFVVGTADNPYLQRWYIIPQNRFFNVYLHKFMRDDDDRALHDHPWASCSVILKSGYIEHLPDARMELRFAPMVILRKATHLHRIELWRDKARAVIPAWTLFITGRKVREWGFACPNGWRHWRDFCGVPVGDARGDETGRGCG